MRGQNEGWGFGGRRLMLWGNRPESLSLGASETGLVPWKGQRRKIHAGSGPSRLSRVGHWGTMAA